MASTLRNVDPRTQLNSIRATRANVRTDANSETKREFLALIRAAMREVDLSQKAMALNAGCAESVIADGLNGVRNFSVEWLWAQPNGFWVELRNRVELAKGLNEEREREMKAARIGELIKLLVEVA